MLEHDFFKYLYHVPSYLNAPTLFLIYTLPDLLFTNHSNMTLHLYTPSWIYISTLQHDFLFTYHSNMTTYLYAPTWLLNYASLQPDSIFTYSMIFISTATQHEFSFPYHSSMIFVLYIS